MTKVNSEQERFSTINQNGKTVLNCPFIDCQNNRVEYGNLSGVCQLSKVRLESIEVDYEDDSEPPVTVAYCLEYQKTKVVR